MTDYYTGSVTRKQASVESGTGGRSPVTLTVTAIKDYLDRPRKKLTLLHYCHRIEPGEIRETEFSVEETGFSAEETEFSVEKT